MANKNSIAQMKDIRVGKTLWLVRYGYDVKKLLVTKVVRKPIGYFVDGLTNKGKYSFSTGDAGVLDIYDSRPAQVFTNKRAALFFLDHWQGYNPNFLEKSSNNQTYGDIQEIYLKNKKRHESYGWMYDL